MSRYRIQSLGSSAAYASRAKDPRVRRLYAMVRLHDAKDDPIGAAHAVTAFDAAIKDLDPQEQEDIARLFWRQYRLGRYGENRRTHPWMKGGQKAAVSKAPLKATKGTTRLQARSREAQGRLLYASVQNLRQQHYPQEAVERAVRAWEATLPEDPDKRMVVANATADAFRDAARQAHQQNTMHPWYRTLPKREQPPTPPAREQSATSGRVRRQYDRTKLIRAVGGWQAFTWSEREAQHLEQRDAAEIKAAIAAPPPEPCEPNFVEEFRSGLLTVRAYLPGRPHDAAGSLTAERDNSSGQTIFKVGGAFIRDYRVLASCVGIGTKMYEAAARAACKHGGVLAGSAMRSAFSQGFWVRQLEKKRATCKGDGAGVYPYPQSELREALKDGRVTVPQYNQLVANLPATPDTHRWPCMYVPLKACKGTKEDPIIFPDNTLRGLRKKAHR